MAVPHVLWLCKTMQVPRHVHNRTGGLLPDVYKIPEKGKSWTALICNAIEGEVKAKAYLGLLGEVTEVSYWI
jgi:hypothetical protein